MITQYKKYYSKLDIHYKTSFELNDVAIALANSIRRGCTSLVPTVTFNDEWVEEEHKRSILIKKNSSALHNEFLSHRLGLIPLNMNNSELKIKTEFNLEAGVRNYYFAYPEQVPKFYLKVKNNDESKRDKDGFIEVTTDHYQIQNENGELDSASKYMVYDVFTNDPIILNKLKSNFADDDEGEELDLECKPVISMGKYNARNDPTGTVTFQFKIDESKVEETFNKKIDYMNEERERKKLDKYTEEEIKQFRKSFDLLDIERVYIKNDNNEAKIFQMSIESIGFMNPDQIFMDCIKSLYLMLKDIINSINFKNIGTKVAIDINKKIIITETTGQRYGTSITIKDENHTVGNLITYYLRKMYNKAKKDKIEEETLLKYVSYRMNHPTIEEIEIIMIPFEEDNNELIRLIKNFLPSSAIELKDLQIDLIENMESYELRELLCVLMLIKSINLICLDLQILAYDFSKLSGKTSQSFINNDKPEFFTKYSLFWGTFNTRTTKPYGNFRKGSAIEAIQTLDTIRLE